MSLNYFYFMYNNTECVMYTCYLLPTLALKWKCCALIVIVFIFFRIFVVGKLQFYSIYVCMYVSMCYDMKI